MDPARYRGHVPALDGVRGLAILLVLAHNFHEFDAPPSLLGKILSLAMNWGWVGVQLFFVLSGFLITGVLLDTRRASNYFGAFYGRRSLRIFPLYYSLLLVVFVILPLFIGHQVQGYQHQIWLWTYLANWVVPFGLAVPAFAAFWSLAVEEQFYLVWPFVVLRLSSRRLGWLCIALAVLSLASRIIMVSSGVSSEGIYMFTISRLDALVLGAAAALLLRSPTGADWVERRLSAISLGALALFVAGGVVTGAYPRASVPTQTLGYSILAVVFTVVVVATVVSHSHRGRLARWLSFAPLRAVGKYSYAMYVFHKFLHDDLGEPLLNRWFARPHSAPLAFTYFVVMTLLTFVAGFLSYHLLEKHFLRLKGRFEPKIPAEPATAAQRSARLTRLEQMLESAKAFAFSRAHARSERGSVRFGT